MVSNVKNPVWKMLSGYIVFIFLLIVIAMVSGCSSRKVNTSILKTTDTSKEQIDTNGQTKKEDVSEVTKSSEEKINKVDEDKTVVVTEKFDNGALKERTTETRNVRKTDNSNKKESSVEKRKIYLDSVFVNRVYKTEKHTSKSKDKDTDVTNYALYWMLGVVGIVLIVALFLYLYIRKK